MKVDIFPRVTKFINDQDLQTSARIQKMLETLEMEGYKIEMPYSKQIGNNMYELRIKGKKQVRLIYTFKNNKALVFYGFIKKTQKIPIYIIKTIKTIHRDIDRYNVYVINIL
jgi:hypothetical protein